MIASLNSETEASSIMNKQDNRQKSDATASSTKNSVRVNVAHTDIPSFMKDRGQVSLGQTGGSPALMKGPNRVQRSS
jgi:hypothetical protein